MSGPDDRGFRAAVAELGAIQAAIVVASKSNDEGWRREVIALRRRLQVQVATLSQLLDGTDPVTVRALRDAFNRMRSKVALHQASWPAVAIDRDDPGYRASVQDMRATNREFIALAERTSPGARPVR